MRCVECHRRLLHAAGIKAARDVTGVLQPIGPVGPVCARSVLLMPADGKRLVKVERRMVGLYRPPPPRKPRRDTRQCDWVLLLQEGAL